MKDANSGKPTTRKVKPPLWLSATLALCLALCGLAVPGSFSLRTIFGARRAAKEVPSHPTSPESRRGDVKEVIHGVEIADPYRWLEDQKSPDTRAWIKRQNDYTQSILGPLAGREQLKQRLGELMKIDTVDVPIERNGRYFFMKRLANQDLFVIRMRQGATGKEEVLIDPHPMSADHTTSVELLDVSKDGSIMAYGVRQGGEDEVQIRLLGVNRRADLADRLRKARYYGVALKPDNSGFYYTRRETQGPRVYYHAMGTGSAADHEIFGKSFGEDKIIFAELSDGGHYLIIHVAYGTGVERLDVYYQDLSRRGPIQPVVNDIKARFYGHAAGDTLFLHTDWKAPRGRVLAVDLRHPARGHWREVVPERDAVIDGIDLAGGKLFVNYMKSARSHLKVFGPDGRYTRDIALPAMGSVSGVSGRWDGQEAFFAFSSFYIPTTIYSYEVANGRRRVWARLNLPIDTDKLAVKQVWYASKDQTRVPMFLVHAKGIKLDGSHPALLTGYGGFNISLTPRFTVAAVLLSERGGVFALPSLRGGGEFGQEWHRAGMLAKKQNVFDDFMAAAEWLIQRGYTQPSKLGIMGGSNGGLLTGAALTQRPELFQAVVCRYPLLDMVRYHRFLVASTWVPEYGSSDDPEQFKYIYAYSPYQHVKPGTKYPAVLLVSGDGDTRVDPLHARKMAALLQSATGSDRPVLLDYDTASGHSGGRPLNKQIDDLADELAFLFWQLGG